MLKVDWINPVSFRILQSGVDRSGRFQEMFKVEGINQSDLFSSFLLTFSGNFAFDVFCVRFGERCLQTVSVIAVCANQL